MAGGKEVLYWPLKIWITNLSKEDFLWFKEALHRLEVYQEDNASCVEDSHMSMLDVHALKQWPYPNGLKKQCALVVSSPMHYQPNGSLLKGLAVWATIQDRHVDCGKLVSATTGDNCKMTTGPCLAAAMLLMVMIWWYHILIQSITVIVPLISLWVSLCIFWTAAFFAFLFFGSCRHKYFINTFIYLCMTMQ